MYNIMQDEFTPAYLSDIHQSKSQTASLQPDASIALNHWYSSGRVEDIRAFRSKVSRVCFVVGVGVRVGGGDGKGEQRMPEIFMPP